MDVEATADDFWDVPNSSGRAEGYGPSAGDGPPQAAPRYAPEHEEQAYEEEPLPEAEPALSEVERRLIMAQIYNQYLTSPPFEASDALTQEVAAEFAAFARFKMEKLLGITTAASFESDFSDMEVQILKAIAKKVAQQTGAKDIGKPEPPRPARTAPPPMRAVPPPVQRPAPRQQQAQRPRQPAPRPAAPQRPPAPQRPAARPAAPQKPNQPQKVPRDGEVVADGQRAFRIRWVQMNPNEFGEGVGKRLEAMRPETAMTLPNGLQVFKTTGEEYFKVVRQDMTPQARDGSSIPFPNAHQMAFITANQAAEASQAHSRLALKVGGLMSES